MTSILANLERWRARQHHERLESEEPGDTVSDVEINSRNVSSESEEQTENETDIEAQPNANFDEAGEGGGRGTTEGENNNSGENPNISNLESDESSSTDEEMGMFRTDRLVDRMTLRELEEERDLVRRRTSACMLLVIFLLFRLWIEALTQGDFGLLLLCLVGTSWIARFVRYNREREEELDRRIQQYAENNNPDDQINRSDLRMMSFQAQLALAIMESQRQMMQGGFGNPDGPEAQPGVSDQAKSEWEIFQYKDVEGPPVKTNDDDDKVKVTEDEEPHCTICLGEYEDGDTLVKLPCGHVYHDECIAGWTSNHVRCPLCNFDLESMASEANSNTTAAATGPTASA